MSFWKQFKPKSCSVKLKSSTKDGVLTELVGNLVKGGSLDESLAEGAIEALKEREELASTGVGMNVAIPHIKLPGIDRVAASLSVHPDGVEWAAVDGDPVHIYFTILRPEAGGEHHDPEQHLEMIRWIARLSREADFRSFAQQAKTKTELVDLLKEMANV